MRSVGCGAGTSKREGRLSGRRKVGVEESAGGEEGLGGAGAER